jgi:hypothetical protein
MSATSNGNHVRYTFSSDLPEGICQLQLSATYWLKRGGIAYLLGQSLSLCVPVVYFVSCLQVGNVEQNHTVSCTRPIGQKTHRLPEYRRYRQKGQM